MRLTLILIAAAILLIAGPVQAQPAPDGGGIDIRGYDEADRTPEWNYRRGEVEAKGAYYDAGRYGPLGLLVAGAKSDLPATDVLAGLRDQPTKAASRRVARQAKTIATSVLTEAPRR